MINNSNCFMQIGKRKSDNNSSKTLIEKKIINNNISCRYFGAVVGHSDELLEFSNYLW